MKILKLKNKLKNERGAITIFVLAAMLFFLIILVSIYTNNVNKKTNIDRDKKKIEEQYNVTDEDLKNKYNEIINKDSYPEPWAEMKLEGNDRIFNGTDYHPKETTEQKFPEILGYPDENNDKDSVSANGKKAITVSATIKPAPMNSSKDGFIVGNVAGVGWNIYSMTSINNVGFCFSVSKTEDVWENLNTGVTLKTGKLYNLIATFSRGKMILNVTTSDMEKQKYEKDTQISELKQFDDINTLIGGNPKRKSDPNFGTTIIDNGTGFYGGIYDVKIWDRVLNDRQKDKLAKEQIELYKDQ
mgnify:CR=1 FL=1